MLVEIMGVGYSVVLFSVGLLELWIFAEQASARVGLRIVSNPGGSHFF